jgi:hypothetical protein
MGERSGGPTGTGRLEAGATGGVCSMGGHRCFPTGTGRLEAGATKAALAGRTARGAVLFCAEMMRLMLVLLLVVRPASRGRGEHTPEGREGPYKQGLPCLYGRLFTRKKGILPPSPWCERWGLAPQVPCGVPGRIGSYPAMIVHHSAKLIEVVEMPSGTLALYAILSKKPLARRKGGGDSMAHRR